MDRNTNVKIRKPRRSIGTPFHVHRNWYSLAIVGAGALTWVFFELWPESKKLKHSIQEGSFKYSEELQDSLQAVKLSRDPTLAGIVEKLKRRQEAKDEENSRPKEQSWLSKIFSSTPDFTKQTETISKYFIKTKEKPETDLEEETQSICDKDEDASPENSNKSSKEIFEITSKKSSEISESPYKDLLSDTTTRNLNSSFSDDKDFKTPKPLAKIFTKTRAASNAGLANKLKMNKVSKEKKRQSTRKPKERQSLITKTISENFSRNDVDGEHLQMALALSKSVQDMENTNNDYKFDEDEDVTECMSPYISTQEKVCQIKKTLEQFGFTTDKSNLQVERRKPSFIMPSKRKKSKYKYITPTLFLRTEAERESLISTKVASILQDVTISEPQSQQYKSSTELILANSHVLRKLQSKNKKIFHLNNLDKEEFDKIELFYVDELDLEPSESKCGCLLKDWTKIPGRDVTPPRQLVKEANHSNFEYRGIDLSSKENQKDSPNIKSSTFSQNIKMIEENSVVKEIENFPDFSPSENISIEAEKTREVVIHFRNSININSNTNGTCSENFSERNKNISSCINSNTAKNSTKETCNDAENYDIAIRPRKNLLKVISLTERSISPDLFESDEDVEMVHVAEERSSTEISLKEENLPSTSKKNGFKNTNKTTERLEIFSRNLEVDHEGSSQNNFEEEIISSGKENITTTEDDSAPISEENSSLTKDINSPPTSKNSNNSSLESFKEKTPNRSLDTSDTDVFKSENGVCHFESYCADVDQISQECYDLTQSSGDEDNLEEEPPKKVVYFSDDSNEVIFKSYLKKPEIANRCKRVFSEDSDIEHHGISNKTQDKVLELSDCSISEDSAFETFSKTCSETLAENKTDVYKEKVKEYQHLHISHLGHQTATDMGTELAENEKNKTNYNSTRIAFGNSNNPENNPLVESVNNTEKISLIEKQETFVTNFFNQKKANVSFRTRFKAIKSFSNISHSDELEISKTPLRSFKRSLSYSEENLGNLTPTKAKEIESVNISAESTPKRSENSASCSSDNQADKNKYSSLDDLSFKSSTSSKGSFENVSFRTRFKLIKKAKENSNENLESFKKPNIQNPDCAVTKTKRDSPGKSIRESGIFRKYKSFSTSTEEVDDFSSTKMGQLPNEVQTLLDTNDFSNVPLELSKHQCDYLKDETDIQTKDLGQKRLSAKLGKNTLRKSNSFSTFRDLDIEINSPLENTHLLNVTDYVNDLLNKDHFSFEQSCNSSFVSVGQKSEKQITKEHVFDLTQSSEDENNAFEIYNRTPSCDSSKENNMHGNKRLEKKSSDSDKETDNLSISDKENESSLSQGSNCINDEELNYSSIYSTPFREKRKKSVNRNEENANYKFSKNLILKRYSNDVSVEVPSSDEDDIHKLTPPAQKNFDELNIKSPNLYLGNISPSKSEDICIHDDFDEDFPVGISYEPMYQGATSINDAPNYSQALNVTPKCFNDSPKTSKDIINAIPRYSGVLQHPRVRNLSRENTPNKDVRKKQNLFNDSLDRILEDADDELEQINKVPTIGNNSLSSFNSQKDIIDRKVATTPELQNSQRKDKIETPEGGFIIKTRNVTPIANYDAMSTPKIMKELQKYGLKAVKRARGIQILKYIYESTHPVVGQNATVEEKLSDEEGRVVKKRKRNSDGKCKKKLVNQLNTAENEEFPNADRTQEQKIEIVGDILGDNDGNENLIFERKQSVKVHSCRLPLQIAWHNLLSCHPELKQNILMYEPLQLEVLQSMLKEQGFKYHIEDLLMFLDRKCITIRTNQGQSQRKRY